MTRTRLACLLQILLTVTGCANDGPSDDSAAWCYAPGSALHIVDPETEAGRCGVVVSVHSADRAAPIPFTCAPTSAGSCECAPPSGVAIARVLAHDVTTNELLYDGMPLYDDSCGHAIVVQPRKQ